MTGRDEKEEGCEKGSVEKEQGWDGERGREGSDEGEDRIDGGIWGTSLVAWGPV